MRCLAKRRGSQRRTSDFCSADGAHVWSLGFRGGVTVDASASGQLSVLSACDVKFLDLVDSADGESLRLYFDAEAEENMAEPMSSSLAVLELPCSSSSTCTDPTGPAALGTAWAGSQWAWYPDAAYVCCSGPGQYRGCLVWGHAKTECILSALTRSRACSKVLAFSYGYHPADAALLGLRTDHVVDILVQVSPGDAATEDLWCRLPGAELAPLRGATLLEHHTARMTEVRVSQALRNASCSSYPQPSPAAATASPPAAAIPAAGGGGGGGCHIARAVAAAARACGLHHHGCKHTHPRIAAATAALPLPGTCLLRGASDVSTSVASSSSWGPISPRPPPLSVTSCASSIIPLSGTTTPGSGTPTHSAGDDVAVSQPQSPGASGGDVEASPFAVVFGREAWDEEEFVIVACGGW